MSKMERLKLTTKIKYIYMYNIYQKCFFQRLTFRIIDHVRYLLFKIASK